MTNDDAIDQAIEAARYPRFGGRLFQGQCNVNDCVPFWVFAALVCVQILSILVYKNTIDSETGQIRPATVMEKASSVLRALVIDFILACGIFYYCRECRNDWAWFVLLLPLLLMGLLFFVFVANASLNVTMSSTVQALIRDVPAAPAQ